MKIIRDQAGAGWEKRGNTAWVQCDHCDTWFPVSPEMLKPGAPDCHCPGCGRDYRPVAGPGTS